MRFFVSDTRKWFLPLMLGIATILALGGLGRLYLIHRHDEALYAGVAHSTGLDIETVKRDGELMRKAQFKHQLSASDWEYIEEM